MPSAATSARGARAAPRRQAQPPSVRAVGDLRAQRVVVDAAGRRDHERARAGSARGSGPRRRRAGPRGWCRACRRSAGRAGARRGRRRRTARARRRDGSSSFIASSSRITPRSVSSSSASRRAEVTMSRDDVDRHRQVVVEHPGVVAGVLLAGGGVRLAADGVERLGDVHRGAPRGALEQQVLEEVRRAVVAVGLVARADADPGADGRRAQARHVLGQHPDPAGQDGTAHERRRRPARRSASLPGRPGPRRAGGRAARQASAPLRSARRRLGARSASAPSAPPRRRRAARACRAGRSRRSRPGPSGPRRGRPRRSRRACRRPACGSARCAAGRPCPATSETNAPKRRRLDHGADEALADLGHVRVGDRVDRRPRGLGRRAVGGADVDRAVVLDRDVGAGLLLDLVDHLALRPDDLADLVDRDLHRDDARGERATSRPGASIASAMTSRIVQPRVAGLGQRAGEHRRGDAVELGVELDGRDELAGAGDLEVHVTERVLGAEDVGQRGVARSRRRPRRRPGPSRCRRPGRAAAHRR